MTLRFLCVALLAFAAPAAAQIADPVAKARDELNLVENAADRAVYACERNQLEKCTVEARTAARAASRALYAIDRLRAPDDAPPPAPVVPGIYVDPVKGSDAADGKTPATAWRHAPGDPEATGNPASYLPQPGDRIVFAEGRYSGSITAKWQGTAAKPIVIEGAGPGAIIDGSSAAATAAPCASQADCGGVANWRTLARARFAADLLPDATFAQGPRALFVAQWPDPTDPFYSDETTGMQPAEGADLNAGMARIPAELAAQLTPAGLKVAVWALHNVVPQRSASSIEGTIVRYEVAGAETYTDRTTYFALRAHPALISRPGEYAILPDRRTVLFQPVAGAPMQLLASMGRSGIDLAEAQHVTIRNLAFENFADTAGKVRSGIPILAMRKGASNIRIEGNRFSNLTLRQSTGAITLWDSANASIVGNTITGVAYGSALRILRTAGLEVLDNYISRLGRTGLMMMGVTDALVAGNRIHDILGVHGNGLSAYNYNERIRVIGNSIWQANQPVTMHGNGGKEPIARDLLFARNLFVAHDKALGGLISWGGNREVALVGNVILGGDKGAVRLNSSDTAMTLIGNVTDGVIYGSAWPADWTVSGNAYRKLGVFQRKYQPEAAATFAFEPTGAGDLPGDLGTFCAALAVPKGIDARFAGAIGADFTCR